MYGTLTRHFAIFGMSVYGMLRYGFNIVFVYICLFSLLVVVWGAAAVIKEKKESEKDEQDR